jgi:serine/threonine-protein kinase
MRFLPGTRLSRYEIRALLGAGGMGEVYRAHDTTLRRDVALKVLSPDLATHPERLRRLEQEALAASSLNHPNILTIYEIGVQGDTPFIATELVAGESLRERMARGLELREILDVGLQAASALGAAHAAGIVHRDIKPENIMVRHDGIVKVLDFGLAKLVLPGNGSREDAVTQAATNTAPGLVLGTVQYMSPEQARGFPTDARTDIWSLGAVLYELLARRSAFEGPTSSDVLSAILRTEPPPLARYVEDLPQELGRIVTKALEKDREERYQAVKDLGLDLKNLKRRLEFDVEMARTGIDANDPSVSSTRAGSSAATARIEPTTARSPAYRRRVWRSLALVAGIGVLAALGYAGYSAYGGGYTRNVDSIAVLPFTNESGDPENEYLSDGISETLINTLSQLSNVKVIARSSSFRYKNKTVNPQEAARALRVEAVVLGRVAKRGENLIISAELIDTRDETQMWGDRYNRNASDLLAVQTEISREIGEKLRRRLTNGEQQQLGPRGTAHPKAYELLLKGRFYSEKGGVENRKKGIEYYQQALAVDPSYALALTELSVNYRTLAFIGVLDSREYGPPGEAAARKALELDASLAEAHLNLAAWEKDAWKWSAAERGFTRAIELNPNLARAYQAYAIYLSLVGRHDEAIAHITRARELDPLSPVVNAQVGYRFFFARRYDDAIRALKQALELDPAHSFTHIILGYTYVEKGMYRDAIAAYQEGIRLGGGSPSDHIYLAAAHAKAGDRERAQGVLKRSQSSGTSVSPAEVAVLYTALGDKEQAFQSLDNAYVRATCRCSSSPSIPPLIP